MPLDVFGDAVRSYSASASEGGDSMPAFEIAYTDLGAVALGELEDEGGAEATAPPWEGLNEAQVGAWLDALRASENGLRTLDGDEIQKVLGVIDRDANDDKEPALLARRDHLEERQDVFETLYQFSDGSAWYTKGFHHFSPRPSEWYEITADGLSLVRGILESSGCRISTSVGAASVEEAA